MLVEPRPRRRGTLFVVGVMPLRKATAENVFFLDL
jgi:hypothetical protein